MTAENNSPPPRPSSVRLFFRVLIRILFTILIAIGLGIGIFLGVTRGIPALEKAYLEPVQNNQERVQALETQQARQKMQQDEQITNLQEQLHTAEAQITQSAGPNATLEWGLVQLSPTMAAFQSTLQSLPRVNQNLQTQLNALETQQSKLDDHLSSLATAQVPASFFDLKITLFKVMTLLTRTQQSLLNSNYGDASEYLRTAQELLENAQGDVPGSLQEDYEIVLGQIESAYMYLPEDPLLARDELELAWSLLLTGFSDPILNPGETTPTPALLTTPTPTFTPTP